MRTILAKNIKNKLEKKIKGKISVSISDYLLIVSITNNRYKWQYVEEISDIEISHGMTSDEKANDIYVEYVKAIKDKFFK